MHCSPSYESRAASESPCCSSSELESKTPEEWLNNIANTDFVKKIRQICDLYTEIVKLGLEALQYILT